MTKEKAAEILEILITNYDSSTRVGAALDLAILSLLENNEQTPIDSLPVEDVEAIETWTYFLEYAPGVVSITIRLSDGKTLYTIEKDEDEV